MSAGDWLLFYQMGFFSAAASVGTRIESHALAAAIWGIEEADELQRVILLRESHPVWAKAWPHREILGARFMGFRRLADERQDVLRKAYGSADAFVRKAVLTQKRPDGR